METARERKQRLLSLLLASKITRCGVIREHCKFHAEETPDGRGTCVYAMIPADHLTACPLKYGSKVKMMEVLDGM